MLRAASSLRVFRLAREAAKKEPRHEEEGDGGRGGSTTSSSARGGGSGGKTPRCPLSSSMLRRSRRLPLLDQMIAVQTFTKKLPVT
ncbi:P2Y purinoceptor 1 isoform 2-T3 [Liasis olivaceus]